MDDEPYQDVYFIGVALPPVLSRQIATLQWGLYEEKTDMLKPLVPHVTLLHPPNLRGVMPSELIPQVREVARRYVPLTIELTGIGFFGRQVCFLHAESHKLISLQSQLVSLLPPKARQLHYKRDYSPHITIAQKYQPNELDVRTLEHLTHTSIRLPLSFRVGSVSCFTRIKPRQYAEEPIG